MRHPPSSTLFPYTTLFRSMRKADGDAHPAEKSGRKRFLGIGKNRPNAKGAGFWIDLVVHEINRALERKTLLLSQSHIHRPLALPRQLGLAFANELANANHRPLIHVEIAVNRIDGDDIRQHGRFIGSAADQVANADLMTPDSTCHRRF